MRFFYGEGSEFFVCIRFVLFLFVSLSFCAWDVFALVPVGAAFEFKIYSNQNSGCISTAGDRIWPDDVVRLWDCSGRIASVWRGIMTPDGAFLFKDGNTGRLLEIENSSLEDNAFVRFTDPKNQDSSQKWEIVPILGVEGFQIKSMVSRKCLASGRVGTRIYQEPCRSPEVRPNQIWGFAEEGLRYFNIHPRGNHNLCLSWLDEGRVGLLRCDEAANRKKVILSFSPNGGFFLHYYIYLQSLGSGLACGGPLSPKYKTSILTGSVDYQSIRPVCFWNIFPIDETGFQLSSLHFGKCLKPESLTAGSLIELVDCSSIGTDTSDIWDLHLETHNALPFYNPGAFGSAITLIKTIAGMKFAVAAREARIKNDELIEIQRKEKEAQIEREKKEKLERAERARKSTDIRVVAEQASLDAEAALEAKISAAQRAFDAQVAASKDPLNRKLAEARDASVKDSLDAEIAFARAAAYARKTQEAALQVQMQENFRVQVEKLQKTHEVEVKAKNKIIKALCFTGETPILVRNAQTGIAESRPIDSIGKDDWVMSCNLRANQSCEFRRVERVQSRQVDRLRVLHFDGKILRTTDEHPFYEATKKLWVRAKRLEVGSSLLNSEGEITKIEGIETESRKVTVYNLKVEGNRNYYAGGVLVHNCNKIGIPLPEDF